MDPFVSSDRWTKSQLNFYTVKSLLFGQAYFIMSLHLHLHPLPSAAHPPTKSITKGSINIFHNRLPTNTERVPLRPIGIQLRRAIFPLYTFSIHVSYNNGKRFICIEWKTCITKKQRQNCHFPARPRLLAAFDRIVWWAPNSDGYRGAITWAQSSQSIPAMAHHH